MVWLTIWPTGISIQHPDCILELSEEKATTVQSAASPWLGGCQTRVLPEHRPRGLLFLCTQCLIFMFHRIELTIVSTQTEN